MLKKWWFWTIVALGIIAVVLIGVIILSTMGFNSMIDEKEQQLVSLKDENNKIQTTYRELTDKISELQKEEEQEEINNKIQDLKDEQKELETEISDKKSEKTSLEKDLEKLNGDIITATGKAKSYPAGQLVAGKDFEAYYYKYIRM